MTIFLEFPTLACACFSAVGLLPLDKGVVTYHGFRAITSYAENRNPKLCSLVKKVQKINAVLDIGTACWTVGRLINSLDKKYRLFQVIYNYYWFSNLVGWGLLIGVLVIAVGSVKLMNKYFSNKVLKELKGGDEGIAIDCKKPYNRVLQQALTLTGVISNIALAVLSTAPYFYATCAVLQGITLLNQAKEKWIQQVTRAVPRVVVPALAGVQSVDFFHYFRIFDRKNNPEACAICLDDEEPANIYFCGNHIYHAACAIEAIKAKNQLTLTNAGVQYKPWEKDSNKRYTFTLNRENVSPCPSCRQPPVDHDLEIKVKTIYSRAPYSAAIKYA